MEKLLLGLVTVFMLDAETDPVFCDKGRRKLVETHHTGRRKKICPWNLNLKQVGCGNVT